MMMDTCHNYANLQLNESMQGRDLNISTEGPAGSQGEEGTPVTFWCHLVGQWRGE